ncbi:MAG: hypothetical protein HY048_06740 [Acidobacteria bacterium]|nr:hypothetical protein [Acidobacteriota bacterium]
MRKIILALAAVVFSTMPALAGAQETTEHVTRTLKLDPGGTLRLKSFSGPIHITVTDRPEVVIDAVRYGTRERLSRIALDIHADGSNTVVVDANHRDRHTWFEFSGHDNVVKTDFDIKVPRRTNLDVSVFSAPVSVDGVEGRFKAHGFSSRLEFQDVIGPIEAHTFSGPISIRAKTWQPNQTIDVDTFSGNVDLHVPENARGSVWFKSFSGHLDSGRPLVLRSGNRKSLHADLGNGGDNAGQLSFKTFSGSVKIDK